MTAAEQLEKWVDGLSIHRYGGPHSNLTAIDPPGFMPRRWRCVCGTEGYLSQLRVQQCPQGGECCPDFSCCHPPLQWSREKRLIFAGADDATKHHMLASALNDLMDYEEKRKVKIIT